MSRILRVFAVLLFSSLLQASFFYLPLEQALPLMVGGLMTMYFFISYDFYRWVMDASEETLDKIGYEAHFSFTREDLARNLALLWPVITVKLILSGSVRMPILFLIVLGMAVATVVVFQVLSWFA